MKRFGVHVFILVGLIVLVTLPTIGLVNYLDASAEVGVTYEDVRVAGVDLSGVTEDEASARLGNAVKDFSNLPFSVSLVDGRVIEVGKDAVTFDITKTLDSIAGPGDYAFVTTLDEDRLAAYIESQPVTMTMITSPLLEAASHLKSTVSLEKVVAENEVVASFTIRPTPAMQSVLDRVNGFEMNGGDIFSLKAFGEDFDALTELGPSFYRMFASTPFDILERVPHKSLPSGVELGYDVKIDTRANFAVQNRQSSPYGILVLTEGDVATVQLLGMPFEATYESRVDDVETVPFPKIIRFSSALASGASSVTQTGQDGETGKLYRVIIEGEKETAELLGFDFYEPTPEIVTKSSVPLPPPAPIEPQIPTFSDDEETLE